MLPNFQIFTFFLSIFISIHGQQVSVTTQRGPVIGYHVNYGNDKQMLYYGEADIFLGIPYVRPPVGPLRFAKPVSIDSFDSNPWNATYFRSACPQNNLPAANISEDCLYLNIYTPNAISVYKYPVMVWIHGGSFQNGFAAQYAVMGGVRNFVTRGVVIVTLQYRLGLLGFFTTHTDDFPPNLGLLDQVEALKFIQQEIVNFGGNPYSITLFGNSAGAASIDAHTYNLFQQAILQSGTIFLCFEGALGFSENSFTNAQSLCNYTRDKWNTHNYTDLKNCLQTMDYQRFLNNDALNLLGWKMSQDNYFMPDVPRNLYKDRSQKPKIIGNTQDEWALFDLLLMIIGLTTVNTYSRAWLTSELQMFGGWLGSNMNITQTIMENIFTSIIWTGFAGREIEYNMWQNNSNVFVYEFTWDTKIGKTYSVPGWNPIFHTSELPIMWMGTDTWGTAIQNNATTATDIIVANSFGEYWTNFAKFGQPTLNNSWANSANNIWQSYEIGEFQKMRPYYRTIDRTIWNQVLPAILGTLPPEMPDYNNGTNVFAKLLFNALLLHKNA